MKSLLFFFFPLEDPERDSDADFITAGFAVQLTFRPCLAFADVERFKPTASCCVSMANVMSMFFLPRFVRLVNFEYAPWIEVCDLLCFAVFSSS